MANAMALDSYPGFKLGGCIFGKPSKSHTGYSQVNYKGKAMGGHRVAWIKAFGPIPEGMVVDHSCHTEAMLNGLCRGGNTCIHRSCVNPEHLQLISHAENVREGSTSFRNRTHCLKGLHELTPDNIGTTATQNYCKACWRANGAKNMRALRARRKAEANQ